MERNTCNFDSSDRDKLASCLTLFGQMGTVLAPERLQIKSFAPSFYFDREEDNRIRLEFSLIMEIDRYLADKS